jgi:hypothetical protein
MGFIATVDVNYQAAKQAAVSKILGSFVIGRGHITRESARSAPIRGSQNMDSNNTIRQGEIVAVLPDQLDTEICFVWASPLGNVRRLPTAWRSNRAGMPDRT